MKPRSNPARRKPNATGRGGAAETYVMLRHFMLDCPAWAALSGNAVKVLIAVWRVHNGLNNGKIGFAVRAGEKIGLSKDKTSRALTELEKMGFLKIAADSSFTRKTKESREWTITAEPCGSELATKDFMRITAESGGQKRKTQSHHRDTQSRQCDTKPKIPANRRATVAPVRPSPALLSQTQSHQRDTYIYTMGGSGAEECIKRDLPDTIGRDWLQLSTDTVQ